MLEILNNIQVLLVTMLILQVIGTTFSLFIQILIMNLLVRIYNK